MGRLSGGRAVLLWAVLIAVGFALGRATAPSERAPSQGDLAPAIRAALAESDGLTRTAKLTGLLEQLNGENLPGVVAVYDEMLTVLDKYDIRPFVLAWTRFDPAAALDHALAWPYRIKQEPGVEAAIYGWALSDPLSARLAAEQVSRDHPHFGEQVFHSLVAGWTQSGREGLVDYIDALPEVPQDGAIGVAVGALMRKGGADAAIAWAEALLQGDEYGDRYKLSVFRRTTRSVARNDPERAASWTLQYVADGYADDRVRIIGDSWGELDGPVAMAWVREQPVDESRELAVRATFASWFKSDPQGATAWLENETLDAFHDPAISLVASRVGERFPANAVEWCERISDPDKRINCLKTAANRWYQQDAVAAEEWLQQSPLDEDLRGQVRQLSESSKRKGRKRLE